jgi:hypothetical protein
VDLPARSWTVSDAAVTAVTTPPGPRCWWLPPTKAPLDMRESLEERPSMLHEEEATLDEVWVDAPAMPAPVARAPTAMAVESPTRLMDLCLLERYMY